MSATVTLHIYSGRDNPAWELSDDQINALSSMLSSAKERTLSKPEGIVGQLGYRGFSIDSVGERKLEWSTYLHGGIADVGRFDLSLVLGSEEAELFLLSTAGDEVDSELRGEITTAISTKSRASTWSVAPFAAPPYDPGKWNNDSNIRTRNNCYNYASDKITNTFAQPGRGSGQMYSALDCGNVGSAAQRDGQISIPNPNITPANGHIASLVIWPGRDFHWYRRDSSGMWSHKPGQTPARNVDNSGRPISNPQTCDRGPYSSFCGFYNSIPAQTRIN